MKDIRGFLANKVGISFLHEASKLAQKYSQKGGIEYIDSIMGTFTGRALPPIRTIDYIGIDVYLTILENIGSSKDVEETPRYLLSMQQRGWLGKKESGGGCYRKRLVEEENASRYQVFDIESNSYRDQKSVCFPFAKTMITHLLQGNIDKAFETLRMDDSLEGKICKHLLVYYIFIAHQATVGVAYEMEAIDTAMEQGYGWLSPRKMVTLLSGVQEIEHIIESNKRANLSIEYDDLGWVDDFMVPVSENDLRFFPLKRW